MSRIGRMPIAVPAGVEVVIAENNHVTVKGPKGTLERTLPSEMDIKLEGEEVVVTRPNDLKKMKSLHGLTRTLIHNSNTNFITRIKRIHNKCSSSIAVICKSSLKTSIMSLHVDCLCSCFTL